MSYKLRSDVNFTKNVIVQNKNIGLEINLPDGTVNKPDANGNVNVNYATTDVINSALSAFPLIQYGNLYENTDLGITGSGFTLQFTKTVPLFMGGLLYNLAPININLSTIKASPANTTFFVYVRLVVGIPQYMVSVTEVPETNVNMFIGKVSTNATAISSIGISTTSRFDMYRPSTVQQGSAFPVSTGHPTDTGTINW